MYLFALVFCRRTLLSLLVLFLCALNAAAVKIPKNIPQPPQHVNIDQEVLLLLAGATPEDRTILTLNNNRDDLLTANITAYTLTGEAVPLPDVEMVNGESLQIELGDYLTKAGVHHIPLGFLKVHYVGVTLEMGAQLTLYPPGTGIGVDSPRSLVGDFKSTERAAVFWRPTPLTHPSKQSSSAACSGGHSTSLPKQQPSKKFSPPTFCQTLAMSILAT